jgi:hypothetical protein
MTAVVTAPVGTHFRAILVESLQDGKWTKTDGWDWYGVFNLADPRPGAFSLTSPADQATLPAATKKVDLVWTVSPRANYYEVYFGTSPSPSKIDEVSGTTTYPVDVTSGQTYYWTVVAKNSITTTPTSSGIRQVSIQDGIRPGPFTLTAPHDQVSFPGTTTNVVLSWNEASGATSYDVYFGESPSFGGPTNVVGRSTSKPVAQGKSARLLRQRHGVEAESRDEVRGANRRRRMAGPGVDRGCPTRSRRTPGLPCEQSSLPPVLPGLLPERPAALPRLDRQPGGLRRRYDEPGLPRRRAASHQLLPRDGASVDTQNRPLMDT